MRYTLRQLEVFLAIAHHQNITKAAQMLSMSQSAASGALKDLEQQFDLKLFDRLGKRLHPNNTGEKIRIKAEALLAHATELELELTEHNQLGKLTVGATLTIGDYLCIDLIHRYLEEAPGAQVKLEVVNTSTIAEKLLNFDIDLALVEGELHHADLQILPWREDELICFCSPAHPLAKKGVLIEEDLRAQNWILREPGSGTRQAFDHAMRGIIPELNITLELQHTEAIKMAVEKNLGISCLSEITLQRAFHQGDLIPLTITGRDLRRRFYFIIHKQKYRSAGILRWMEFCGVTNTHHLS